jgi:hypothetical protein
VERETDFAAMVEKPLFLSDAPAALNGLFNRLLGA